MSIAIIVHGGAGLVSPERIESVQSGCKEAALIGWHILQQGGSALNAVQAAVQELENNPHYNAGTGSCLTQDGNIEMDAGMMEGYTLRVGAVANVELLKNPILLARQVLESPHVLLVGKGAQRFALEHGMTLCARADLLTERQYERWLKARQGEEDEPGRKHGTVGAVALDSNNNLAVAVSTGGIANKYPGRVGDSPLVGCGFYADENAAVSCTGDGEDFTRLVIAKRAVDFLAQSDNAQQAAKAAITLLEQKSAGTGGLILLDRSGNIGIAWNSKHMVHAYMTEDLQEPQAAI